MTWLQYILGIWDQNISSHWTPGNLEDSCILGLKYGAEFGTLHSLVQVGFEVGAAVGIRCKTGK